MKKLFIGLLIFISFALPVKAEEPADTIEYLESEGIYSVNQLENIVEEYYSYSDYDCIIDVISDYDKNYLKDLADIIEYLGSEEIEDVEYLKEMVEFYHKYNEYEYKLDSLSDYELDNIDEYVDSYSESDPVKPTPYKKKNKIEVFPAIFSSLIILFMLYAYISTYIGKRK